MCLAYPMKVISVTGANTAMCDKGGVVQRVDMTFLSDISEGDWVTVHLGIAREKISQTDAQQILDALTALDLVRSGEADVDHLFSDLIGREPKRPDQ